MGKKDKAKKKGKGAEKTLEKTEKKIKLKIKKNLGEDDVEAIVKAIEEEEKKRQEVKEVKVGPPSHRSNLSIAPHPEAPEIVLFGGEFYNGQKTVLNNDLLFYDLKRREWKQVKSPAGPPPRCSHQAVVSAQSGGQMWVFGGEYASPSESQFHHYKDLWVYHFASKRWEKIPANKETGAPPSARSGHRMVMVKRHLVVFGGFHDNLSSGESKYFNDVHVFDTDERKWKKVEISGVKPPAPRSGCAMFAMADGRVVVYGGFCKEKKAAASGAPGGKKAKKGEDNETGRTLADMYLLAPDKHDTTMSKWRWFSVKQTGNKPVPRSGMSCTAVPNTNRAFLFGGVQDDNVTNMAALNAGSDDDEEPGVFFNDLYSLQVENEKATWNKVELTGKKGAEEKKRRRAANHNDEGDADEKGQEEDEMASGADEAAETAEADQLAEEATKVIESGAFTITSTVNAAAAPDSKDSSKATSSAPKPTPSDVGGPSPRFGSALTNRQGVIYLFGGMVEDAEDRQLTFNDFYSLDTKKLEVWDTLIESDIKAMEWIESESSGDEDSDEDDDDSDDMDTD